jgi:hypothetical protein
MLLSLLKKNLNNLDYTEIQVEKAIGMHDTLSRPGARIRRLAPSTGDHILWDQDV